MLTEFVKVAELGDVKEKSMIPVTADGEDVLLALIEGEYFAIGNRCTHFEACLTDGYLFAEDREVQCPLHDSRFNLRSGEPADLPASDPVPTYGVQVVGNDIRVGPKYVTKTRC